MQLRKILILLIYVLGTTQLIYAQRAEFGINAGAAGYMGDLNQFNPIKLSGPNLGAFGRINFDPHWGLGLHYNWGRIQAEDAKSNDLNLISRNLSFRTSLHEVAFIGNFNFLDMYSPGSRRRVSPYLFVGAGGLIFKPNYIYRSPDGSKTLYPLRELNTEDLPSVYKNYAIVIPYGAGVKYKKSENWTLFGQIGYRTVFTDYLDDVSGVYPVGNVRDPKSNIELSDRSGEVNGGTRIYRPGDQRGDFRKRDTYLFVNIGISYTFVSQKCFTF